MAPWEGHIFSFLSGSHLKAPGSSKGSVLGMGQGPAYSGVRQLI